jgi:hypothetical protein
VRELSREPGPALDLGQQIGDVDARHQAIQVGSQLYGCRALVERVGARQLQATSGEPDAGAGVDRVLQAAQRLVLLDLELAQALIGVQRAPERDGELVALTLPALRRHEEPGGSA